MKSGNLNFLEPSGPLQACNGTDLPFTFYVQQPSLQNRVVYEIMWKNIVELDRPQMTIWRMQIACCIPKTTNTPSEYVILNAFPLQQWFHEGASLLHYV